jgi:hypothetical protein
MSGGIAILLAIIILAILAVLGIALYITGGALWWSNANRQSTRFDREDSRPEHKEPTSPTQEHTHFVGAPGSDKTDE